LRTNSSRQAKVGWWRQGSFDHYGDFWSPHD